MTCSISQELPKYLGSIIDVASQLVLQGGEVGEAAHELITYLLLDHVTETQTVICDLDPLPEVESLATVRRQCERIQAKAGRKSLSKVGCFMVLML